MLPSRLLWLTATTFVLAGCSHIPLASYVTPEFGVGRYAAVPADSVRVVEVPVARDWQSALADSIGAPYEVLATILTLGAGGNGAAAARASFRRRVGEVGGNAAALLSVQKELLGPYTQAFGEALRVLPPMPDAARRCERLDVPDSAAARVVACREAARLAPTDPVPLRDLAVAHLALVQRGGEWRYAARAAERAGELDSAFEAPAPYLPAAVALFHGDSLRAYKAIALLLGGGQGVLRSPASGALAAYREVIRLAPDSIVGYASAVTILLTQHRPDEALRVAAALARRRPDRVQGWALAAVATNVLGDHVRSMRYWARVLEIDPKYFRPSFFDPPAYGWTEHRGSKQRVGKQPPATIDDLPPG